MRFSNEIVLFVLAASSSAAPAGYRHEAGVTPAKRQLIGDIVNTAADLLGVGYGYDDYDEKDYDYKNKRQILGDLVGTVGDIIGDLTPFGYDGDRYDSDYDYKNKRQVVPVMPEVVPVLPEINIPEYPEVELPDVEETPEELAEDVVEDVEEGYEFKSKRQVVPVTPEIVPAATDIPGFAPALPAGITVDVSPEIGETPAEISDDLLEDVEDEFSRRTKSKRQLVGDILGTVGDIAGDLTPFDFGYDGDYDEYKSKNKRQLVGDILGTVGDIAGDLTPFDFGYDGDYDEYKNKKNKRQLVGDILGTVGDIAGDLTPFDFGYDGDYDDYKNKKSKRQLIEDLVDDVFGNGYDGYDYEDDSEYKN